MKELDQVVRAALLYEAASMTDDADLELAEEGLRNAIINFVESNYAVMVPR